MFTFYLRVLEFIAFLHVFYVYYVESVIYVEIIKWSVTLHPSTSTIRNDSHVTEMNIKLNSLWLLRKNYVSNFYLPVFSMLRRLNEQLL